MRDKKNLTSDRPRDRKRTANAKRATLNRKQLRAAKYATTGRTR